ncbi:MAG TPA: sigma-70 family RNA polymerase sigma factor [Phycisphaerae bacterium]|nr:sigma-70 family RNA polymerase sigma factor [Phycisphaerae bacterium]
MFGAEAVTDAQILEATQGSVPAREAIAEALAPQVRAMVLVRLAPGISQDHAVEDLSQQALMDIIAGLPTLRNPVVAALKRFASTIVSRRVADFIKSGRIAQGRAAASLDSSIAALSSVAFMKDLVAARDHSPRSVAARAEQTRAVLEEMGHLKQEHRTAIALAFFDQLPIVDIAEHFGISRPAASMLLLRAVRTLRRNLTGSSKVVPRNDA